MWKWLRTASFQVPVLEWLMWQMGGFGPMPGQVHHFLQVENPVDQKYGLERYSKETRRLYGVLDKQLAGHEYVAGECSVADFAILGCEAGERHGPQHCHGWPGLASEMRWVWRR